MITAEWSIDTLIAGGPNVRARALVLDQAGRETGQELPVVSGTVDVDDTRAVRRTLDVEVLAAPEWTATSSTHLLDARSVSPY